MAPAAGKAVIGSNIPTFADRYRGDFSQRMPLYLLQFPLLRPFPRGQPYSFIKRRRVTTGY